MWRYLDVNYYLKLTNLCATESRLYTINWITCMNFILFMIQLFFYHTCMIFTRCPHGGLLNSIDDPFLPSWSGLWLFTGFYWSCSIEGKNGTNGNSYSWYRAIWRCSLVVLIYDCTKYQLVLKSNSYMYHGCHSDFYKIGNTARIWYWIIMIHMQSNRRMDKAGQSNLF